MEQKDYYQILGFHRDASESEERFKEISEAYTVLSDPEKRRKFNRFGYAGFKRRYTREDIFRDFNFEEILRRFGFEFGRFVFHQPFCGKRGRGCGHRRAKFTRMGFFEKSIDDSSYRKEIDQIYDLPLTLQEALYGTKKEIIVETGIRQKQYYIQIPPGRTQHSSKPYLGGIGARGNPISGEDHLNWVG